MNKVMRVPMQLTQRDEFISIPIKYSVVQENENVTIYDYKVDLSSDEIPDWLTHTEFSCRKVYKSGITSMCIKPNQNMSIDTALFAHEVMTHIRVKEKYKDSINS